MTNKEAIEWLAPDTSKLKINMAKLNGENPLEHINEAIEVAIKALKEQERNRWIPVSERPPEDDNDVLVMYEYNRYSDYNRMFKAIDISHTFNGQWTDFDNGTSGWAKLKVIAWKPLPEQYRESENGITEQKIFR